MGKKWSKMSLGTNQGKVWRLGKKVKEKTELPGKGRTEWREDWSGWGLSSHRKNTDFPPVWQGSHWWCWRVGQCNSTSRTKAWLQRRRSTVRIVAGAITRQWQLERPSQVLVPCAGTTTGFDNMVLLTATALQMWFYMFDWRLCALIIFIWLWNVLCLYL